MKRGNPAGRQARKPEHSKPKKWDRGIGEIHITLKLERGATLTLKPNPHTSAPCRSMRVGFLSAGLPFKQKAQSGFVSCDPRSSLPGAYSPKAARICCLIVSMNAVALVARQRSTKAKSPANAAFPLAKMRNRLNRSSFVCTTMLSFASSSCRILHLYRMYRSVVALNE